MNITYIIFAYLIGSIPTAYIYFKIKNKKDIRNYGSGNSGTLNISRSYSFNAAAIVLLIDLIKSSCIAIIGKNIDISDSAFYFATIMAVIGHNFPFYLKFKGGTLWNFLGKIILLLLFKVSKIQKKITDSKHLVAIVNYRWSLQSTMGWTVTTVH